MAGESIRRVYEIDVKLAAEAAATLRAMQQNLKDLEGGAAKTRGALKGAFDVFGAGGGLGGTVAAIGGVVSGFRQIIDTVALVPTAFFNASRSILETQASLERLRLGFSTINPAGLAGAADQIEYVRRVTRELGIDFNSTAQSYLKLSAAARGTNLEGARSREIFEALSTASRNLGLATYQTENAFRAVEQIMSKGVVQQEELRGQLSEAIPGAVQIAARAFGVTTDALNEMIKRGEVFADEFVPKFAAQLKRELGTNVAEGVNDAVIALNNLRSTSEQAAQAITDSGLGAAAAGQFNILSDALDGFAENIREATKENAGFWGTLLAGYTSYLKFINPANLLGYQAQSSTGIAKQQREQLAAINSELEKIGPNEEKYQRQLLRQREIVQGLIADREALLRGPVSQSDVRRVDQGIEAVERTRLARILGDLKDRYKDLSVQRDLELSQLEKLRVAGKFAEDPAEYDRLRAAIIKKTEVRNDDTRAAERGEKALASFVTRLKEEIESYQILTAEQEKSKRQAREEAELTTLAAGARTAGARALAEEAKGLLEKRNQAELTKQAMESASKADKDYYEETDKRIKKLVEATETDQQAIEIFGKEKEQVLQLAIAKLELAKVEADRLRIQKTDRGASEEEIAQLEILIQTYEDAIAAKQGLLNKEYEKDVKKLIEEADKLEKDAIKKRTDELRESLITSFKSSGDIGDAFTETLKDALEKRTFKVLIEPLIDPLVESLNTLVDEFGKAISQVLRNAAGSQSATGGGFWSAIAGALTSAIGGTSGVDYGQYFADGGIMTSSGSRPLRRYASGGIADSPQLAMFGEGAMPEAYVPLPDGRSIPVTVSGSQGGAISIAIYNQGGESRVNRAESRQTQRGTEISVFLEQITGALSSDISRGRGLAPVLETQYGLNRAAGAIR